MQCKSVGCLNWTKNAYEYCGKCLSMKALATCNIPKCKHYTITAVVPCTACQETMGLIRKAEGIALGTSSRRSSDKPKAELDISSGGDNDYWIAEIKDPKRLQPYKAECEDLIEYFQFNFAEGEAFKALWRKGMANLGQGKPGDTPLRNAEKVHHMGGRMIIIEQRKVRK